METIIYICLGVIFILYKLYKKGTQDTKDYIIALDEVTRIFITNPIMTLDTFKDFSEVIDRVVRDSRMFSGNIEMAISTLPPDEKSEFVNAIQDIMIVWIANKIYKNKNGIKYVVEDLEKNIEFGEAFRDRRFIILNLFGLGLFHLI